MRMTQAAVISHIEAMNACYARVETGLRDLDILLGEAERRCDDPKALAKMRDVWEQAHDLFRR